MGTLAQTPVDLPEEAGQIFVVGYNGSGTTMIAECLGRHHQVYWFPGETSLIPFFLGKGAGRTDLEEDEQFRSFWREIAESIPEFRRVNDGSPPPMPDDWQRAERSAAGIFDAIFRDFAAREGKRLWCEKSPQNMQHMEEIAQAFPRAKFIHIIRDGRDCAASLHRRWRRTPKLIVHRWRRVVEDARRQGEAMGDDRYFEVRYEDLTRDPRSWMKDLLGFLDLPFSEDVLTSTRPQTNQGGEIGEIEAQPARWRSYFSPETIDELDRIAGPFLGELGYPRTLDTTEPKAPGKLQLLIWRSTDFVRALLIQNRRRRERNPDLKMSLWSDILASLRNFRSNRI